MNSSSASSAASRTSISRQIEVPAQSLPEKVLLVISASVLVAVFAHVSLPLPFTPIPLTLSDFAVILVGLALGPVGGFAALALYLVEGAAGLPVFTPIGPGGIAHLLGPTAGYLFSYPLVAAVAGVAGRFRGSRTKRFLAATVCGVCGSAILFASGAAWLTHLHHLSLAVAWGLTIAPFLFGSAAKIVAAAGIYSSFRRVRKA